jgi:hypothetical protein
MNGINSVLEESIRLHAHNFGLEKAHDLAYSAGVSVTEQGKVTLLVGDPFVVLLRLARLYTLEGKMAGLHCCLPLLAELQKLAAQPEYAELVSLSWPLRALGGSQSDQHQFEPRVKS